MAKKRTKIEDMLGAPLPEFYHPKDTRDGMVLRNIKSLVCASDMARGTIHIACGGSHAEITVERAEAFARELACVIDCVKRAAVGKSDAP